MEAGLFFAPVIGLALIGFAVVIGLAVFASARDRKRVEALRVWAQSRDFSYTPRDDALGRVYGALPYEGFGRVDFENVLRGSIAGRPAELFDYTYRTRVTESSTDTNGTSSTTSRTTNVHVQVLSIELPRRYPDVTAAPQGIFSRVAVAFGGQDVEIGDPGFDRAYRVKADDEAAARAVLGPLAAGLAGYRDQTVLVRGNQLMLHRPGTLDPAMLDIWIGLVRSA